MGHSLGKLRRFYHQNQTQVPPIPYENNPISSSSSTFNSNFEGSSTQNISIPSSSLSSSSSPSSSSSSSYAASGSSYSFAVNAPRPYSSSMMASPPFFSLAPPPYVDHKTAKKIKNDVNIHKDTITLFLDHNHLDSHLLSFTFDAPVDGSITVFYFAKEGHNCNFMPMYPEIYMPKTIPFQKGLAQKFYQPSGTGIDLGFFEFNLLSRPSKEEEEDIFPLVISAEASLPSLMESADIDQPPPFSTSPHVQITQAVLKLKNEVHFEVKVIKQILWIEGIQYELREIYEIENCNEQGFDDDNESSGACVICMTEPKDTAVLPCRHMCMCSECAKQLRLKSKRCPVCRHLIQELIEIKIENQTKQAVLEG